MTRLRTYDPLLGNCRRLRRLADDGGYRESSVLVLILVAAFVAVMVALLWAAWTVEAVNSRGDTLSRGGGMPVAGPVAVGAAGSPRGVPSLPAEAAEIPRAGGEESGEGLPGVGADLAIEVTQ